MLVNVLHITQISSHVHHPCLLSHQPTEPFALFQFPDFRLLLWTHLLSFGFSFLKFFHLSTLNYVARKKVGTKKRIRQWRGGVMWWKPGSRTGKSIFFFDTLLFLTARRTEYKLMHLSSYTCCNTQGKSGVQIWLPCMDTAQTSCHHSSERWAASGITGRHESCTWCNLIQPLRHHSTVTGLCLQLGSFLNFKEEWSVHD